jgi:catechol 2,3-dioxygenase-like lactoylglutathione lyase family enzyme
MTKAGARTESTPTLGDAAAIATVGVKDLKAARKFYEKTLGLEVEEARNDEVVTYASGGTRLFVYHSEFGGTNKATSVTWVCRDVDALAIDLKKRGVRFEHYDFPNMKLEGDVHVAGKMRAAWFKDPDGNVLAIVNAGDGKA